MDWHVPRSVMDVRIFWTLQLFSKTLPIRAWEFGLSTLWLVNTPEIGNTTCGKHDIRETWEHVGVMACAVKILYVDGIGAGNPMGSLRSQILP
jgi:hypothetical protein